MEPSHWAWQRQRPAHHAGAIRSYGHDTENFEIRGPHRTPRAPCDQCVATIFDHTYGDDSQNTGISWYLSSSSSSSSSPSSSEEEFLTIINSKGKLSVLQRANNRRFQSTGKFSASDTNRLD